MTPETSISALGVVAVQLAGERAAAVLARIGGPEAQAAREELARLAALPRDARVGVVAATVARLRASRPPGVERVHPSWWPADDRRLHAIVEGAAAAPEVRVWAERRLLGGLAPMPTGDVDRITAPRDLPRARPDWLVLRIERAGLRQLAHATAVAPKAELGALAMRLGARGKAFVEAVTWAREVGEARLGPRRAAAARCEGAQVGRDPHAFLVIGARALASHVGGGELAVQVAQRLPREAGEVVLRELRAWAGRAEGPVWAEFV